MAHRGGAYDEHYRTLWHSRQFTRESLQATLAFFLDVPEGGDPNGNEIQHALRAVGAPDLAGRRVLDCACGTGVCSIYFALAGARVCGFDRSPVAVAIAGESARRSGVGERVSFSVADARKLPYPDRAFDAVFCQSALHILVDYDECPTELARVLKPGGRAVFCDEALGHNPVLEAIRYFRRQKYRECGGRPLKYRDIARFGGPFSATRVHHFNLTLQVKTLLASHLHRPGLRAWLRRLDAVDRRLLGAFPWLQRFCGKVVVEYVR